jgi:hypothetical protein
MEVKKFDELDIYLKGFEIESIGNKAIRQVQAENKKLGIPLVYSVDGKIYYELATGEVTLSPPPGFGPDVSTSEDILSAADAAVNTVSNESGETDDE